MRFRGGPWSLARTLRLVFFECVIPILFFGEPGEKGVGERGQGLMRIPGGAVRCSVRKSGSISIV